MKFIRDVIVSVLRLLLLEIVAFFTGIHHILFNSLEVSNISLGLIPSRRDRDKLSFLDDLRANTAGVAKIDDTVPFRPDDFDDDDIEFNDEDIDNSENDDNENDKNDDNDEGEQ